MFALGFLFHYPTHVGAFNFATSLTLIVSVTMYSIRVLQFLSCISICMHISHRYLVSIRNAASMSHTHVVLYTEHVLDMWYSTLQIGALHSVIASARPRARQLLERVRVEGVHTSRFEDLPVGTVLLLPALLRDAEDARAVNARRLGALLCRARVEGGLRLGGGGGVNTRGQEGRGG